MIRPPKPPAPSIPPAPPLCKYCQEPLKVYEIPERICDDCLRRATPR